MKNPWIKLCLYMAASIGGFLLMAYGIAQTAILPIAIRLVPGIVLTVIGIVGTVDAAMEIKKGK